MDKISIDTDWTDWIISLKLTKVLLYVGYGNSNPNPSVPGRVFTSIPLIVCRFCTASETHVGN